MLASQACALARERSGARAYTAAVTASSEPDGTASMPSASALSEAVRALLRPLVRLLISKGVGLPAFMELVKDAYVDVAVNEFPVGEKKQTDSRISLLTGVHRKDVKRLRTQKRRPITAREARPRREGASTVTRRPPSASSATRRPPRSSSRR